MANPNHPEQPGPEQVRSVEQEPQNDTGDLALLAEFEAAKAVKAVTTATDRAAKDRRQKNADLVTGAHRRIADVATDYRTPQEAIQALNELEQGWIAEQMKPTMAQEASKEEIDTALAEIRRARSLIEQNQNTDIYSQKDFSDWLKDKNTRLREERQTADRKREQREAVKTTRQIDEIRENLGVAELPPREAGIKTLLANVVKDERREVEERAKGGINMQRTEPYLAALRTAFDSEKDYLSFINQTMIDIFDAEKKQQKIVFGELSEASLRDELKLYGHTILNAEARRRAIKEIYNGLPEKVKSTLEQARQAENEHQEALVRQWNSEGKPGSKAVAAPIQLVDRLYYIFRKKDLL